MKFYTLALCAALGAASQTQAAGIFSRSGADERVPSGWEIGVALGSHQHSQKEDDVVGSITFDTSSMAYKLFGGYRFNRYFAVEAAYLDGGDASESFIDTTTLEVFNLKRKTRGYQASVLGALPLGASAFSLFGRVGYLDWKSDDLMTDGAGIPLSRMEFDGSDPFFGGGLMADMDGAVLRLEYEYADLDVDDDTISLKSSVTSLSVAWIF
jgi:hypothetical protein